MKSPQGSFWDGRAKKPWQKGIPVVRRGVISAKTRCTDVVSYQAFELEKIPLRHLHQQLSLSSDYPRLQPAGPGTDGRDLGAARSAGQLDGELGGQN